MTSVHRRCARSYLPLAFKATEIEDFRFAGDIFALARHAEFNTPKDAAGIVNDFDDAKSSFAACADGMGRRYRAREKWARRVSPAAEGGAADIHYTPLGRLRLMTTFQKIRQADTHRCDEIADASSTYY